MEGWWWGLIQHWHLLNSLLNYLLNWLVCLISSVCCCELVSVSPDLVTVEVNSIRHENTVPIYTSLNKVPSLLEAKSSNFPVKWLSPLSILAMISNNINNILNHGCLIGWSIKDVLVFGVK